MLLGGWISWLDEITTQTNVEKKSGEWKNVCPRRLVRDVRETKQNRQNENNQANGHLPGREL